MRLDAYVLEATGNLIKLNASNGLLESSLSVGINARHVSVNADTSMVLVSRFITPPLHGESTTTIDTNSKGGEVLAINPVDMSIIKTITLQHSDKPDTQTQGSGVPNYLSAAVISPDGSSAWVPSKQDNVKRGALRNGLELNFQNTVRAISSKINLLTLSEDYSKRVDHDNSSLGSAAVYHPSGVYLFVALETSRQVAVLDAIAGIELFKFDVGRAPQGLTISEDGKTLYVQDFMDRSVSIIDLSPLVVNGELKVTTTNVVYSVNLNQEKLSPAVLLGKQLFYDAKDVRLSRDSYMSCASCHNDGNHDGRVWDLTGFGEGLRNTIALKGRSGMGHGFLHWSANFDEVQDFEKQIRELAGGLGLMSDAQYNSGTRNQAMGDKKAGISTDLDLLATYIASLNTFEKTPYSDSNGGLTSTALAGKQIFNDKNCISCHTSPNMTNSLNENSIRNIGTIKTTSGKRLNESLNGIDVPTLIDVWKTAPYLHDGSASNIADAISAHNLITVNASEMDSLVKYVMEIGTDALRQAGNTPPTVNLTSPAPNTTVVQGGSILMEASASDSDGIAKVEFYDGDTLIATDTTAPYSFTWTTSNATPTGSHSLNAKAYDSLDAVTTSANVSVTVNQPAQNTPPIVNLTSPAANATFTQGTTITISATASDTDGSIARVEFYDGATLVGTSLAAPYSVSLTNAAVGPHNITARAFDNQGAQTTSANVSVTVNQPAQNTPPIVNLTSPAANATFTQGTTITISATASDTDGSIARVEFYDGATLVGTSLAAPYSVSLTNAAVGPHNITARAFDNQGAQTTSANVSVTVNQPAQNTPPIVNLTSPAANATFTQGTTITISATASDTDGSIARVEFYDGATLVGTSLAAPYSVSLTNAAVGPHNITARAFDNQGAQTTSASINLTVSAPPATTPVLLSQSKVATQSSTITFSGITAAASFAVDGNTNGAFFGRSLSHTINQQEVQPWWQVDLGQVASISQVRIYNRTDCCATRLANFYVFSSNTDMTGRTLSQLVADPSVTKQLVPSFNGANNLILNFANAQGRFIRIQLVGTNSLELAEVQVFGSFGN